MRGSLSRGLYLILVCWTEFITVDGECTGEMPLEGVRIDCICSETICYMLIVLVFYIQKNMQSYIDYEMHIKSCLWV